MGSSQGGIRKMKHKRKKMRYWAKKNPKNGTWSRMMHKGWLIFNKRNDSQ